MNQQQIQVEVRTVYGNDLIYPKNEAAHTLAAIAGTKTLSRRNLEQAKSLGFEVVRVFPSDFGRAA